MYRNKGGFKRNPGHVGQRWEKQVGERKKNKHVQLKMGRLIIYLHKYKQK